MSSALTNNLLSTMSPMTSSESIVNSGNRLPRYRFSPSKQRKFNKFMGIYRLLTQLLKGHK
jgi:hypothetical protein